MGVKLTAPARRSPEPGRAAAQHVEPGSSPPAYEAGGRRLRQSLPGHGPGNDPVGVEPRVQELLLHDADLDGAGQGLHGRRDWLPGERVLVQGRQPAAAGAQAAPAPALPAAAEPAAPAVALHADARAEHERAVPALGDEGQQHLQVPGLPRL